MPAVLPRQQHTALLAFSWGEGGQGRETGKGGGDQMPFAAAPGAQGQPPEWQQLRG